jgi:DNA repair protein RadA
LITKLKNAGIQSIFDLAVSVPIDLLELCPGYNERVALDLVMRARKVLTDSGTLAKEFSTAEDLLERRKNLLKCTTGSSRFDSFFEGWH